MRILLTVPSVVLGGLLLWSTAASAQVFRCEGADGRVTYTNEPCPSTARKSRTVDDSPPVQAQRERAAAKTDDATKADIKADTKTETSDSTKADAAKEPAKDAGKDSTKDAARDGAKDLARDATKDGKAARAAAAGATPSQIRTATTASNLTPAQQMEQLDLERARQRRACEQLERRLAFARSDVDGATGGQRASAELQLRRLQEDYLLQCPMQR